jgi:Rhodopirellula transposase DDE domain
MNTSVPPTNKPCLDASHVEDLKLAASKRLGAQRRSFQAAMAVKYCQGHPRRAEEVFGWSRHTVALGLHERRTGIICLGAHEASCGNKLWEERHPEAAAALRALAETHSQPDPTFRTTLYYTRLTAAEAIKQLRALGFAEEVMPSPSTMAQVLNRNGYRLRPVLKAKPQKKSPRRMPSLPTSENRTHLPRTRVQPNG